MCLCACLERIKKIPFKKEEEENSLMHMWSSEYLILF